MWCSLCNEFHYGQCPKEGLPPFGSISQPVSFEKDTVSVCASCNGRGGLMVWGAGGFPWRRDYVPCSQCGK